MPFLTRSHLGVVACAVNPVVALQRDVAFPVTCEGLGDERALHGESGVAHCSGKSPFAFAGKGRAMNVPCMVNLVVAHCSGKSPFAFAGRRRAMNVACAVNPVVAHWRGTSPFPSVGKGWAMNVPCMVNPVSRIAAGNRQSRSPGRGGR